MRNVFSIYDRFFVISFLPTCKEIVQTHFIYEEAAKAAKNKFTIGMWKIKELKK